MGPRELVAKAVVDGLRRACARRRLRFVRKADGDAAIGDWVRASGSDCVADRLALSHHAAEPRRSPDAPADFRRSSCVEAYRQTLPRRRGRSKRKRGRNLPRDQNRGRKTAAPSATRRANDPDARAPTGARRGRHSLRAGGASRRAGLLFTADASACGNANRADRASDRAVGRPQRKSAAVVRPRFGSEPLHHRLRTAARDLLAQRCDELVEPH